MSLADKLQMARFLAHLARGGDAPDDPRLAPLVREAFGARYEIYLPGAAPRATVVAVHAGDRHGWRQARLVRLCRALARSGIACAVPQLERLSRCELDPGELDALGAVVREAAREAGRPVGLVGFSLGGGLALALAARPDEGSRLRFVVAVGAYHDLGALFDGWLARDEAAAPRTLAEWDDLVYLKLVLAFRFREELGLSPPLAAELDSLLDRFCDEASDEEKRRLFERHLRALPVFPVAARAVDRRAAAALSPAGRLAGVRCPVTLIHDRLDGLVPLRDAERLLDELKRAPGGERHRLVVTELLSHLTPVRALDVVGLARLGAALEPLVRAG
jgi:pimeloyl-ACP methyl ester carboxylesterase